MIINPSHQIAVAQFALRDRGCKRFDLRQVGSAACAVSVNEQPQCRRRDPFVAIQNGWFWISA